MSGDALVGLFVGGASRRMGGYPKGLLPSPGTREPLLVRLVGVVRALGLDVVLVGDARPYAAVVGALALDVVADEAEGSGPLAGLCALLARAGERRAIALACDAPYVTASALERLRDAPSTAPIVAPVDARGQLEPFFARYESPRVLPAIRAEFARGERSLRRALATLAVEPLALTGDEARVTQDWDQPADLPTELRAVLAQRAAPSALRGVESRPVVRVTGLARADADDEIVVEEPLEIRVAGEAVAVTMRTPGDDRALALGFLFAEGIVKSVDDVGSIAHCGRPGDEGFGNVIDVAPGPGVSLDVERVGASRRGTLTTASCGVCGRRTIDDLLARCVRQDGAATLEPAAVARAFDAMRARQSRFERTGGIHAAAACDAEGRVRSVFEDVGRHNAVDKVVGSLVLERAAPGGEIALLLVSGRASFEMVQKAVVARIPIVASVSAASTLAVDLAARTNTTLIGFARPGRMNVYTAAQRIRGL